tara:strand:+ start:200 stop:406 length:207 start_codon:yes stop_codon:yes gene_type:complete
MTYPKIFQRMKRVMDLNEEKYRVNYKVKYGSTKNASKAWKRKCIVEDRLNRKRRKAHEQKQKALHSVV